MLCDVRFSKMTCRERLSDGLANTHVLSNLRPFWLSANIIVLLLSKNKTKQVVDEIALVEPSMPRWVSAIIRHSSARQENRDDKCDCCFLVYREGLGTVCLDLGINNLKGTVLHFWVILGHGGTTQPHVHLARDGRSRPRVPFLPSFWHDSYFFSGFS